MQYFGKFVLKFTVCVHKKKKEDFSWCLVLLVLIKPLRHT